MLADAHTDLLLELAHREHRLGETNVFAQTWLPLLEAGNVGLQVCPVFIELALQPEGSLREALRQVTALHHAVRENPERVLTVRTQADLDAVERGERIGLMLALEGVEPFGYEVATADLFWELGLRMAGLTWNRRNPFADGAADDGGLSGLGRRLLTRFAELGVILDLSHASPRLFDECLETYAGRVCVTHAGCRAVNETPRNLTDEQLRALAGRDGVFGLMLHPIAIDPQRRTIERAIDHLEHAVEVIGADRVCLGGDWTKRLNVLMPGPAPPDGLMPPGLAAGSTIEGLSGPEDYPALEQALRTRSWDDDRIEGILSRNLLRFVRESLPAELGRDEHAAGLAREARLERVVGAVERERGADEAREVESARAHELDQLRQRHRRILGAVDRSRQRLLPVRELERIELELLAARRQADNDGRAAAARPAERELGRRGRADRVEGVVDALGIELLDRFTQIVGRARAGRAEPERLLAARLDRVDDEDLRCAGDPRALDDELPDAAGADHERGEARLRPRRVQHRADSGQGGAAEQGGVLQRHVVGEWHRGFRGDDHAICERTGRRPAIHGLTAEREPGPAAEQGALPDRRGKRPARGRPAAAARAALAAGRRPGEDDAVSLTEHPGSAACGLDHTGTLVPEHDRGRSVPLALVGMQVGAADADGAHADDDLPWQRLLDVELLQHQRAGLVHDGGAGPHRISIPPLTSRVAPVTKPAASEAR